jgi:GDP-mannose 6-dehydrogenase
MPQKISVFGLGYVGSVTAACLAAKGHQVLGVDINPHKVEAIESGRAPVLEKGLEELVAEFNRACRLHATTDAARAIRETDLSFICVATPALNNGKQDLGQLDVVLAQVGAALRRKNGAHTVVLRSTVMPGTTEGTVFPKLEEASEKHIGKGLSVCYNPEFLREGSAISDFLYPTITVLGAKETGQLDAVREVYRWVPGKVFETGLTTAETVKAVCNAFHALKIVFSNEVGTFCKRLNVDTEAVFGIFRADTRLNASAAYLAPGFAFGGSCLSKDLRALTQRTRQLDLKLPVLESILTSNNDHLERAVEAILQTGKKRIGVLGLSFKPDTDDLRESALVQLVKRILGEGCHVRIWDRDVSLGKLVGSNRQFIEQGIPHIGSLLVTDLREVFRTTDVIVVGTSVVSRAIISSYVAPNQTVIDLANLDKSRRLHGHPCYQGICWD